MTQRMINFLSAANRPPIPLAAPILGLYVLIGWFVAPAFLSVTNLISIFFSAAILLPAVLGMQLLLVLGRFDLSVGATASLAGMVTGLALLRFNSPILAISLGLLGGAAAGLLMGKLVTSLRIDPLVATLAGMGVIRSLALAINDGRIVAGLPGEFGWIVEARVQEVPLLLPLALVFTAGLALSVAHLVPFRRFYAVGSNYTAAVHMGLNVGRIIRAGYVLAGIGAASAGVLQTSRTLSASPLQFSALAVEVIAACLIGGGTLGGGRGTVWGAALGMVVVSATTNLVSILGISVFWKDFAVGLLLLVAVLGGPVLTIAREKIFASANHKQT